MTRNELLADIADCYKTLNGHKPNKKEMDYWQDLPDIYLKMARNVWKAKVLAAWKG